MPDAGMIRRQVEERIAELEAIIAPLRAEYDQLKSVAGSFADEGVAAGPRPARRSRTAAPTPRPRRAAKAAAPSTNGGGRTRSQQAVQLVGATPGVTAAELAKAMGISRNYLYRVLPKLEQSGVIKKEGRGYMLASTST